MRCRLDIGRVDALDLFGVGEDAGELAREEILFGASSSSRARRATRSTSSRVKALRHPADAITNELRPASGPE